MGAGRIHSIESFGTLDGPGIRLTVFFQGCPLRCLYCHNPDTWSFSGGAEYTAEEILRLYERNRMFYRGGGLTATGGEPLLQLAFLTELFEEAKKKGIHTCLDTSGVLYREEKRAAFDRLFAVTDLVLLDMKHSDGREHERLTGRSLEPVLAFAGALDRAGIPMTVRHVAVPGITDREEEWRALGTLLKGYANLKEVEILPYHTLGRVKYRQLGIPYPLEETPEMDPQRAEKAREALREVLCGKCPVW